MYLVFIILIIFIILVYLWLPRINRNNHKKISQHFAHRGLHDNNGEAPENSLLAIKKSILKKYPIELDIQLSKDKDIVVFHDFNLKRVCNLNLNVENLNSDELSKLKLLNSSETIPTLDEVFRVVDGKVLLLIEIKSEKKDVSELCGIISKKLDEYNGDFLIESFNPYVLEWFKLNKPEILRGQLSGKFEDRKGIKYLLLENLLTNFLSRPDFIAYDYKYRNNISLLIMKYIFKIPVLAYTLKNKDDFKKNINFFNGLIFEMFEID